MSILFDEKITKIKIPLGISGTSEDTLLEYLLEQVEDIAMNTVYPFEDHTLLLFPQKLDLWTIRACVQMYNHMGQEGVRSYSENGLSITYDDLQNGISSSTLAELTPRAGVPK